MLMVPIFLPYSILLENTRFLGLLNGGMKKKVMSLLADSMLNGGINFLILKRLLIWFPENSQFRMPYQLLRFKLQFRQQNQLLHLLHHLLDLAKPMLSLKARVPLWMRLERNLMRCMLFLRRLRKRRKLMKKMILKRNVLLECLLLVTLTIPIIKIFFDMMKNLLIQRMTDQIPLFVWPTQRPKLLQCLLTSEIPLLFSAFDDDVLKRRLSMSPKTFDHVEITFNKLLLLNFYYSLY